MSVQTVWETFKAYTCRIFIVLKVDRQKTRDRSRRELLQDISQLEALNKQHPPIELSEELLQKYQQLKMINSVEIVQSILYARQNVFEYRDKAGIQLARLLSERPIKHKVTLMLSESGELTISIEEKLEIFAKYYQRLYQLESGGEERVDAVLKEIDMGEISEEHREYLGSPKKLGRNTGGNSTYVHQFLSWP